MREPNYVGKSLPRPDSLAKATGAAKYTADLALFRKDLLYAKALFPPYGHARIVRIDTSAAAVLKGVAAVMTADDLPGANGYGGILPDKVVIAKDQVLYEGDPVALVAAESLAIAEKAVSLIEVEYEPLEGFDDPERMLREDAPLLHEQYPVSKTDNVSDAVTVKKGDAGAAFQSADVIIDNWYRTPMLDHAYLEPDVAIAEPDPVQGGLVIYSPQHAVQLAKRAMADAFNLPQSKIRVVSQLVGGGFGGKEDSTFDVSVIAGVLALKTKRPVIYEFTRDEVFKNTGKRHACVIHHQLAADKTGKLLGIKVDTVIDKGAWKSIDAIPSRTAQYAGGPYSIDHALCRSWSVFTNHPYGCAFRGLGSPQAHFAMESQMDELARRLGMDPVELRLKNILRDGDSTIWGQVMLEERGLGLEECIRRVCGDKLFQTALDQSNPGIRRGRGIACFMYGTGTGMPADGAHCLVQAQPDGSINIGVSASELGQGFIIAMKQLAADTLGISIDKVYIDFSDSAASLESGATVASRTTVLTGNAIVNGCMQLRQRFLKVGAELLHCDLQSCEIENNLVYPSRCPERALPLKTVIAKAFVSQVPLGAVGSWYPPMTYPNPENQGDKMHAYAFGCQGVTVAVDMETGIITVEDAVLACDVGKAINPSTVEGQLQGGMAQAIGWSLMEEHFMSNGRMKNHTYHNYLIPTAMDLPELRTILVEHPNCLGPFGAKGVGEPPIVGAAPAIRAAVRDATGISINEIPITPVRMMEAIRNHRK